MKKLWIALLAAGVVSGCSNVAEKPVAEKADAAQVNAPVTNETAVAALDSSDLYVVFADGRMNVFYDADVYKEFVEMGEVAYRRTFIGAGPKGETLMYGVTKADNKASILPSIEMLEGRLAPTDVFYGEIVDADGRISVFDNWALFQDFIAHGEVTYRFTEIGAGPKGQTVVFSVTKENSKKRPEALMAKFKAFHSMS